VDAISIMKTAAILLAIAAVGGLTMAVIRFKGVDRPPTLFLMAHGVLAAAALTLLIYAAATIGLPKLAMASLAVLVLVAIVGASLNLMFHAKMLPIPKGPIVVHGIVAVVGFVLLLLAVMSPQ
jgi:hypothetical protein